MVNCAAVPANMMEEELFGDETRPGKFSLADGGTLFLDEIEELPLPAQSRLLYFLKQDVMDAAGDGAGTLPDVRLIASACRWKQWCGKNGFERSCSSA